ncbi:Na+/H+ antiporter NhaA [uncultured Muribaculum sp.]|uniref:Na+/H+ antiporter NhaA n=1 Tax=uncultured Muribaculum sp. TaxID=1918613 RepID=UPI000F468D3E|nr:Na+/H+ antiporter NhaA [uncultured Muribaculum sp.]ROT14107.1 Na+/H+ antiporter NhaA [Muribaculaceae bacterium Isolate-102 (HZI)]
MDSTHIEEHDTFTHRVYYSAKRAVKSHASGGNVLIVATILALVVANIPGINQMYNDFWEQEIRLQVGSFNIFSHAGHPMSMLQFINDALMAIFFFTIGLEIKREVLVGELSSFKQALLPIIAAIGGMVVPVGIYLMLSAGTDFSSGAAIPMATDIAFSLGVLAMLGSRVPISLKIFLTTLAVVDDIGGIIVIAAFYSTHIEAMLIVYALILLGVLFLGSVFKIQSKIFYLLIGTIVWYLFLNSGIHPTIAGVLVAFCIPATPVFPPKKYIQTIRRSIAYFNAEDDELLNRRSILNKDQMDWLKQIESASDKVISPLQELEDSLHPVVNYLIIPTFAFANAGITLWHMDASALVGGIGLAIICGLVLGKFLGIFVFSWLTVKLHLAPMPQYCNWKMMASISMLGGIGFTVSLFIANLSFGSMGAHGLELLNNAKLGIVVGSLLAGVLGFMMLHHFLPKTPCEDSGEC